MREHKITSPANHRELGKQIKNYYSWKEKTIREKKNKVLKLF